MQFDSKKMQIILIKRRVVVAGEGGKGMTTKGYE